ncbi:MAG: sodium/solute symporter [Bacteroidales bacterium]|nr:sodium/solute symporter [Bacteroidales bacterium]
MHQLDWVFLMLYIAIIIFIGIWVARKNKGFDSIAIADKSLPWWIIGFSLIASNISAEQIIGMSGTGFAIGLAVASYEWMAAITLILVAKFFLPIFFKENIKTIPQLAEHRYSTQLKTILAVFWICLFIFVNLTSVMFLGAKMIDTIIQDRNIMLIAIIVLALVTLAYSMKGGLMSIAFTDYIHVGILIIAGLYLAYVVLNSLGQGGTVENFSYLLKTFPQKFHMIIRDGKHITPNGSNGYMDIAGLSVLIGGLWITNLYYWGFNQYIIQRAFAAKSLKEAQKGLAFAGYLKLLVPVLVVIPGIVAYVILSNGHGQVTHDSITQFGADYMFKPSDGSIDNDRAYPMMVSMFMSTPFLGIVIAAILGAIISSLGSMANAIGTIFTEDIYKPHFQKENNGNGNHTILVYRIAVAVSLCIAVIIAPFLKNFDQLFTYIQASTGIISPGILTIFLLGIFWPKATNKAAKWGVIIPFFVAIGLKVLELVYTHNHGPESTFNRPWYVLPFMHQMMVTLLCAFLIVVVVSLVEGKGKNSEKAIYFETSMFKTTRKFNISAIIIAAILVFLYTVFW